MAGLQNQEGRSLNSRSASVRGSGASVWTQNRSVSKRIACGPGAAGQSDGGLLAQPYGGSREKIGERARIRAFAQKPDFEVCFAGAREAEIGLQRPIACLG